MCSLSLSTPLPPLSLPCSISLFLDFAVARPQEMSTSSSQVMRYALSDVRTSCPILCIGGEGGEWNLRPAQGRACEHAVVKCESTHHGCTQLEPNTSLVPLLSFDNWNTRSLIHLLGRKISPNISLDVKFLYISFFISRSLYISSRFLYIYVSSYLTPYRSDILFISLSMYSDVYTIPLYPLFLHISTLLHFSLSLLDGRTRSLIHLSKSGSADLSLSEQSRSYQETREDLWISGWDKVYHFPWTRSKP
jgi:hypothetical protein